MYTALKKNVIFYENERQIKTRRLSRGQWPCSCKTSYPTKFCDFRPRKKTTISKVFVCRTNI